MIKIATLLEAITMRDASEIGESRARLAPSIAGWEPSLMSPSVGLAAAFLSLPDHYPSQERKRPEAR